MSSPSSLRARSNNSRRRLHRQQRHTSLECLEARCLLTASPYNWQGAAIGAGGFVDGIFYDPNNANVMYARSDVGGLFKSIDDGQHWSQLLDFVGYSTGTSGNGTQSQLIGVLGFAIDPQNSNNIYADVGQYTGTSGAVFYSTNGGQTWGQTNLSFYVGGNSDGRAMGEQIQVDPNNSNIVYLGSNNAGLWKSTDAGHSFSKISGGVTGLSANVGTSFVLFDPSTASAGVTQTIYLGTSSTTTGTNLFVSTNGGTSWSQVAIGSGTGPASFMPTRGVLSGGYLYLAYMNALPPAQGSSTGGVYRYQPSTGAWANISPASGTGYVGIAADAQHPNTIVVATMDNYGGPDRIFRTVNSNAATPSWTSIFASDSAHQYNFGYGGYNSTRNYTNFPWTQGFGDGTSNWVATLAINPFNSNQLMYGTGQGIWATDNLSNGGANTTLTAANSWYFADVGFEMTVSGGLAVSASGVPLFDSQGDNYGFAHTTLTSSPAQGGIYNSGSANAIAVGGNVVAIGGTVGIVTGASPTSAGTTTTYRGMYSTNGGLSFQPFTSAPSTGSTISIAVSANGGTIGWVQSGRVPSFSSNNGTSWTQTTTSGMPTNGEIVADALNSSIFYYYSPSAGTLWVSSNGGTTFSQVATGLTTNGKLVASPYVSGTLWIAGSSGLYVSTNSGSSFTKLNSAPAPYTNGEFPSTVTQGTVAVGAPAPGQSTPAIYLYGTLGSILGVYRSDDGGSTWTQVNDVNHQWGGLIQAMAADPNVFGRVYLATNGRGIIVGNPASSLPAGWTDADINSPGNPGWSTSSVTLSNGAVANQWIVNGGGNGLSRSTLSITSLIDSPAPGPVFATAVTSTPHGLNVGDPVTISGANQSGYNGTFLVASVINSTTFTYVTTPGLSAATGTITASTSDQFNFALKPVTGNASLTAQLQSLTNADGVVDNPQAGVMFRAGTAATDVFVALVQSTASQLALQYRTTSGGAVTTVSLGSIPVGAEYMQLVRTGNDFAAFYSADGISWTQLGVTTTIASMPATANVGLVATANFNSQLTSATFANVVVHTPGDVNLDGHVNAADVGALMQALSDQDAYQTTNNLSSADAANILDVNGNGTLNFGDLQYLLNLLNSGGGSLAESAPSSTGSASIPVSTLLPSADQAGNSDSSSAASTITFAIAPTTSSTASNSKTIVVNAGNTSSSTLTKKISLATVDQFFNRLDLHGASKRALKQASHHAQQDSLTDALLGSKDFTV